MCRYFYIKGATKMKSSIKLIPLIVLFCVASSFAEDWPQYLGPNRNSISAQKGILHTWPQNGPEVLWTAAIGKGYGGPIVSAGKVYLLDRNDKVGDNLRCFDLSNGKELWNFGYNAPGTVDHPGSRSVPIIDGNNVYTCGPYGDLYCINTSTHKSLWNKNIWKDFGGTDIPNWAITQNPLIYGNLLIVASQAPQAGVVAYDKLTGDVKWTTPSLGAAGYVSPALVKVGGQGQVVMISASTGRSDGGGTIVGIDPVSGKLLWTYANWQCRLPIPSAVDAGEGRILITGGYNAGTAMIKVEKKADGSYGVTELFKTIEFGAHTQPPVLYNGYFYVQYTTNERNDGLVCMSIDGHVKWKTGRSPLFDKGGMILADGLLLATDGRSTLYLIEPDPSAFKPLASAVLLEAGPNQNWAPLALADGKLLIRDQGQLKCVKVAQ
jgi:outer membrane protein assembly factor BamB